MGSTSINLPQLYKRDSKGKMRTWTQVVYDKGDTAELVTQSGLVGGSLTNRKKIIEASTREDAFARAFKLGNNNVTKKMRDGYCRTEEEANNAGVLLRPEKADTYNPDKHHLNPGTTYVQPKINGLKCIYNPEVDELMSKGGLTYYLPAVKSSLKELSDELGGLPVDTELYIKGFAVGDILSAVTNLDNPHRGKIKAHVVTYVSEEPFSERDEILKKAYKNIQSSSVVLCKTLRLCNLDILTELKRYYDQFLYEGWEGLMIRNGKAPYRIGRRTADILKWKPTITKEFPVVAITYEQRYVEELGSVARLVEFHCEYKGRKFKVIPKWSVKERHKWYLEHQYRDTKELLAELLPLEVEFREWTKYNTPFHGVGIRFRDPSY